MFYFRIIGVNVVVFYFFVIVAIVIVVFFVSLKSEIYVCITLCNSHYIQIKFV